MKYKIISDMHLEFMTRLEAVDAIKRLCEEPAHALILAGDICNLNQMELLAPLSDVFNEIHYVFGNHEYYGGATQAELQIAAEAALPRASVGPRIQTERVSGATLWYPLHADNLMMSRNISDSNHATRIEPNREHWNDLCFLIGSKSEVVVTHHLPTYRSVSPKYANSPDNCFFANHLDGLIRFLRPKLWIHGHTHMPMDYISEKTRIVCNPLGYPREGSARANVYNFTVDV